MMTITCPHCGPIRVTDPAFVLAVQHVLSALAAGAAPLGAITCPMCRDEVHSSAVKP
jgi:sarcosine oxidase delta subunit